MGGVLPRVVMSPCGGLRLASLKGAIQQVVLKEICRLQIWDPERTLKCLVDCAGILSIPVKFPDLLDVKRYHFYT